MYHELTHNSESNFNRPKISIVVPYSMVEFRRVPKHCENLFLNLLGAKTLQITPLTFKLELVLFHTANP